MAFLKKKSILIALAVVVLGAVAYFVWMRGGDDASITTMSDGPASAAQATFLTLASRLNSVEFDTNVLTDPRFTSLIDIKTAILPEAAGRKDPFAPLSGVAASAE